MMDPCRLLGAPVADCHPAAQAYRQAAGRIPAGLWLLVKRVEISEDHPTGQAHQDGRIRLPAEFHAGQLWHEAGHLLAWRDESALLDAFAAAFWPNGEAYGQPASPYGARHGPDEDLPETIRRLLRGDRQTARIRWVLRNVPEFQGW